MKLKLFFSLLFALPFFYGFAQTLPKVAISTTEGVIVVEIDTVNAPITGNNFLKHIARGTYENAVFYRVVRPDNQPRNSVKIEVVQGGLFTDVRFEKIEPVAHESTQQTGLKHLNGTVSMARMAPGSASTEFFICVKDQPELDFAGKRNPDGQGFAAFGHVIAGMEVVGRIQQMKDEKQTLLEPVKINRIEIY